MIKFTLDYMVKISLEDKDDTWLKVRASYFTITSSGALVFFDTSDKPIRAFNINQWFDVEVYESYES